jgi:hypothetical protein
VGTLRSESAGEEQFDFRVRKKRAPWISGLLPVECRKATLHTGLPDPSRRGKTLVLEIKGEDSEQNRAKRAALDARVKGVNAKGGFGIWCCDVAFEPAQIQDIIQKHG